MLKWLLSVGLVFVVGCGQGSRSLDIVGDDQVCHLLECVEVGNK